jgi:hypothetical protein
MRDDHRARHENAQDDRQVQLRGRREGSNGHHERVQWLNRQEHPILSRVE